MKIKTPLFVIFMACLLINSCYFEDKPSSYNHLSKDFWLICFEDCTDQHIMLSNNADGTSGYHITDPMVYAVGFNDDFIIAKQHPADLDASERPITIDSTTINYIIIDIRNYTRGDFESYQIHHLNEEGYKLMKKHLGVPENIEYSNMN